MARGKLMMNMSRTFNKGLFKLKAHSPEIMVIGGTIGVVISAVMACKATTKIDAILDKAKEKVDGIHSVLETPELQEQYKKEYGEEYTVEASKKDLAVVYAQTGIDFIKLYGPSVLLGAASITSILCGHNILNKRHAALTAAYAVVDNGFKEYRGRVVERFGEELDRELRYNIKPQEIEEEVTDEEGNVTKVKKTVEVATINENSQYDRFFCEGCTGWDKQPEYNLAFVLQRQHYANQMLQERTHVFLNEIYDMFGIDRTEAGNTVGWVLDPNNPNCSNFIDFGIHNMDDERKRAFVNGWERNVLLKFNLDGNVWQLMKERDGSRFRRNR